LGLKTIREVAEQQSVSKQTIRKKMDNEFRRTYVSKEGNKLLISEAGVAKLIKRLNEVGDGTENHNSQTQIENRKRKSRTQTDPFAILQKQLAVKDEQISKLEKLLDQSQQLQLNTQGQLDAANKELERLPENVNFKQKLQTKTPNQTKKAIKQQASDERKGWFARFFGGK